MTQAIEPTMVVPDSIEPVYGWKALKITKDGRLASPQQDTIWPVKKRLEAKCSSNRKTFAWTAVYGTPKDGPVEVSGTVAGGASFATSAVVSVGTRHEWLDDGLANREAKDATPRRDVLVVGGAAA